jgi:dipeptidyl aminopeptidase/acylaminoacyl peptidase
MRKPLFLFGVAVLFVQAQPTSQFSLTVDNIMRGPALVGYEPGQARWSPDGQRIYFQWKQASQKEGEPTETYTVSRDGAGLRKLTDKEVREAPPANGDLSKDKRFTLFSRDGDIFTYENASGSIRQITKTTDVEGNPRFLADGKRMSFTRGGNLYVMSLEDGLLAQMTDIRPAAAAGAAPAATAGAAMGGRGQGQGGRGGAPAPTAASEAGGRGSASESQEYLKKEQKELLEYIREQIARREEADARRKAAAEPARKPFNLQARQNTSQMQLSPDEKWVIVSVNESAAAKSTIVPNFITESAYTEDIPARSNVGDSQSRSRMAVIDAVTGDFKWVDHGQRAAVPAAAPQAAAAPQGGRGESGGAARPAAPQDRDVQLSLPVWSEDGTKAVMLAQSGDNKDRWIMALDPATGKTRVLASDHDDAWVGGPGQGGPGGAPIGWLKNDREVYFTSERTGYAQLYSVSFDGGEPRALTSGKWEVLNARLSRDKSHFYVTASKDSPYEQHLYEMNGEGGPLTRLTAAPGKHAALVSPDDRFFADIYSYTNKPPELYIQENRAGAEPKRITTSPTAEFGKYAWLDVPIVTFTARDGVKVPARLFKPANFRRGGPAVVFVHGSGYLQNVDKKWSTYYHEYMFNHILMERGFLVIDVDYRGSAGYGRDWRTAIYQHMGGKDLDDAVDAARYIVSDHGVDAKKIGIYGGSYGGFLTLMALFTAPDVFAAGAALRPVTDWATYNHGYTSDILNTPQSDPEAYRKSSPIFFAEGLKGALLICHGMVDTNVEFQDSVRLAQRLIELRKENWELAPFPVENHSFVQPSSWADEYKRILKLFEKNLK